MQASVFFKFRTAPTPEIVIENGKTLSIPSKQLSNQSFSAIHIDDNTGLTRDVHAIINSQDSLVVAAGATGSGKTFALLNEDGLVPVWLCEQLLGGVRIEMQAIEIYQDSVYDLIDDSSRHDTLQKGRDARWEQMGVPVDVPDAAVLGMCASLVKSLNDKRHTAKTARNLSSSRSHLILAFRCYDPTGELTRRAAFVDLAGNERVAMAQTTGTRFKEGSSINTDTLFFWTWLRNIKEGHSESVGARNCNLTERIWKLIDSKQDTQIVVVGCGSGEVRDLHLMAETVKNCQLTDAFTQMRGNAQSKTDTGLLTLESSDQVKQTRRRVAELEAELESSRSALTALSDSTKSSLAGMSADLGRHQTQVSQYRELIDNLRAKIQSLEDENESLRKDKQMLLSRVASLLDLQKHEAIGRHKHKAKKFFDARMLPKGSDGNTPIKLTHRDGSERLTYTGVASPSISGDGTSVVFTGLEYNRQFSRISDLSGGPPPSKMARAAMAFDETGSEPAAVMAATPEPPLTHKTAQFDVFSPDERFASPTSPDQRIEPQMPSRALRRGLKPFPTSEFDADAAMELIMSPNADDEPENC